jgi:hypothetical protein
MFQASVEQLQKGEPTHTDDSPDHAVERIKRAPASQLADESDTHLVNPVAEPRLSLQSALLSRITP